MNCNKHSNAGIDVDVVGNNNDQYCPICLAGEIVRLKDLIEILKNNQYHFEWRGIPEDQVCVRCYGRGSRVYPSTSTWRGGIGGQALTSDVCDQCWGSGNEKQPWTNLRKMYSLMRETKNKKKE